MATEVKLSGSAKQSPRLVCKKCGQEQDQSNFPTLKVRDGGTRYVPGTCAECSFATKGLMKKLSREDAARIKAHQNDFGKVSHARFCRVAQIGMPMQSFFYFARNGQIAKYIAKGCPEPLQNDSSPNQVDQ